MNGTIPDELAQTISLAPAGDGEPGQDWCQDWFLTYTLEECDDSDREKVLVQLAPRALHELYLETKCLDIETRQMGRENRAIADARLMHTGRLSGSPTTYSRRVMSTSSQLLNDTSLSVDLRSLFRSLNLIERRSAYNHISGALAALDIIAG